MSSTSEVGHAKNVANFNILLQSVTALGSDYNPTREMLKLQALTAKTEEAKANLDAVIDQNVAFNNAVNARIIAFDDLRPLATRIMATLKSSDAPSELIDDARGYNRKIQGRRAKPKPVTDPAAEPPKNHSSSQLSYDLILEHFSNLIAVAESLESYAPGKADLKVQALNAKLADMSAKNEVVSASYIEVSNARIVRNKLIYTPLTGLIDTANAVKEYVKSIYGAKSPEFKQVRKIRFRKVKD